MNIIGRKQAQAFKSQLLSGSQNGPCSTPPRWTVLYMDSMDLRNNGLIAWWSAECALTTSINMETPNSKRNLPSIVKMYVCSIIKKKSHCSVVSCRFSLQQIQWNWLVFLAGWNLVLTSNCFTSHQSVYPYLDILIPRARINSFAASSPPVGLNKYN